MKFRKKKNLDFTNGYLVTKKGKIVGINDDVVDLANKLELELQKHKWLEEQPKATPVPNINNFKFESAFDIDGHFECKTPLMDKKVDESLQLMEEIDNMVIVNNMNDMLQEYHPLIQFVRDDKVLDTDDSCDQFDTFTLGNPLEWTEETIVTAIAIINGFVDKTLKDDE